MRSFRLNGHPAVVLIGEAGVALYCENDAVNYRSAASVWPAATAARWSAVLALANLLVAQEVELKKLDIRLAWLWQRTLSMPWREEGYDSGYLHSSFEYAFGAEDGRWVVQLAADGYGKPCMAFGIPDSYLIDLQQLAQRSSARLVRVEALALEVVASASPGMRYIMIIEPRSVILVERERGRVVSMCSERWSTDVNSAVKGFWTRTSLRQPSLTAVDAVLVLDLRSNVNHLSLPAIFHVEQRGTQHGRLSFGPLT